MHLLIAAALLLFTPPPAPDSRPQRASGPRESPGNLLWMVGPRDGRPSKGPPRASAALRERGRILYQAGCARCHGPDGDGKGILGDRLPVPPTDFTKAVYKLRSTPSGTLPTDQDIFATITRGMHGTPMQPWRQLEELDRWALVAQLKSFSPRFHSEKPGRLIEVPLAPRETESLQDHGEQLYIDQACGACHGERGAGDGRAREALRRRGDRSIRIRDFTRGRFIRGMEMEDIFLTLRIGIDGVPMPPLVDLSDHDLWALAAYVRLLVREQPVYPLPPAHHSPTAATVGP